MPRCGFSLVRGAGQWRRVCGQVPQALRGEAGAREGDRSATPRTRPSMRRSRLLGMSATRCRSELPRRCARTVAA
eukprot:6193352-Pyramimonas_sp.AAC.1